MKRAARPSVSLSALVLLLFAQTLRAEELGDGDSIIYVGLGDSYSAGNGAGDLTHGPCRQATADSWQAKIASRLPANSKFTHAACSGGVIDDIPRQMSASNVSSDTQLITMTVGGNDVGFERTLRTCLGIDESDCLKKVSESRDEITNDLEGRLVDLYHTIAKKAPNARIFVAGYPDIVPDTTFFECPEEGILSGNELKALRGLVFPLNNAVSNACAAAGPQFRFVNVSQAFFRHQPCSQFPFINSLATRYIDGGVYHPNKYGQEAYYTRVWFEISSTSDLSGFSYEKGDLTEKIAKLQEDSAMVFSVVDDSKIS